MPRPLLQIACAFLAGSAAGAAVSRSAAFVLLLLGATLLVVAGRGSHARVVALAAAFALGAAARGQEELAYDATPLHAWAEDAPDEAACLTGVAAADPRTVGDRWVLLVDVETVTARGTRRGLAGRARIDVSGEAPRPPLIQGDRITVWASPGTLRTLRTPGAFDRAAQARRDHIHAVFHAKSPGLVRVTPAPPSLLAWIARGRDRARGALARALLPGQELAVVRAMVLGDRSALDPDVAESFRRAGTYHVLAISGAQVALLAGVLLQGARFLRLSPGWTALAVSLPVASYAAFVGADVPVVRAAVTVLVVAAGRALDLEGDAANLVGLAASLLIAWRPSCVEDVGFQLSFAAALAIVLWSAAIAGRLPSLPFRAQVGVAASIAAQAALLPLMIQHFHRLAPMALVLNVAAVPLSGAVMLSGFAVVAGSLVPGLAEHVLGPLCWCLSHALLRSCDPGGLARHCDLRLPTAPWWAVALYIAGLAALARASRRRAAWTITGAGLIALLVAARPPADGRLHLDVLDVGQGDALVLRSPGGRVVVVDAGAGFEGRADMGDLAVAPYLWEIGVRRIDLLVLTHAHLDHVGGAATLAESFDVGEVWEGMAPTQDRIQEAVSRRLHDAAVARRTVSRGIHLEWDGCDLALIGPPRPARPRPTARNDDSLVLLVRLGAARWLLPGDAEAGEEATLGPVRAGVVKVPHHGSRTSSSRPLVAASGARLALVSVGAGNRFGHPAPEVVRRWQAAGAQVLRTDQDGAILVATDGACTWVETVAGTVRATVPAADGGTQIGCVNIAAPPHFGVGSIVRP